MFYISTPQTPRLNWEQMYSQLMLTYNTFEEQLTSVNSQNQQLQNKLSKLKFQNQEILHKIETVKEINNKKTFKRPREEQIQDVSQITDKLQKKNSINIHRVITTQSLEFKEQTSYQCPYDDCNRYYASTVSLNNHIKIKHHGGTKKQRQAYAKKLIDNDEDEKFDANSKIKLPPKFLELYRTNYEYIKKYGDGI